MIREWRAPVFVGGGFSKGMIGWDCKEVGFLGILSVGGFSLGRKERTCGRNSFLRSAICLSASSNAFKAAAEPDLGCFVSIAKASMASDPLCWVSQKSRSQRDQQLPREDVSQARASEDMFDDRSESRIHW